jgi:hypothetical protein
LGRVRWTVSWNRLVQQNRKYEVQQSQNAVTHQFWGGKSQASQATPTNGSNTANCLSQRSVADGGDTSPEVSVSDSVDIQENSSHRSAIKHIQWELLG